MSASCVVLVPDMVSFLVDLSVSFSLQRCPCPIRQQQQSVVVHLAPEASTAKPVETDRAFDQYFDDITGSLFCNLYVGAQDRVANHWLSDSLCMFVRMYTAV